MPRLHKTRKYILSCFSFPTLRNWGIMIFILAAATAIGFLFNSFNFTEANIITVYILGAFLTALFTRSYICSGVCSFAGVLLFNFFFIEPRLTLHVYEFGYLVTFAIMLISSLITGTLAMENIRNAAEKERIAVLAKNEQLRANLLRAISHDLRTPLTSILGNAENLLANYEQIDAETRRQILSDVYDDSIWLIDLVENLLSITRISEGRMQLNMSAQLIDEVITESLRHIVRSKGANHHICTDLSDEILLAQMDARLISQVIINLIDNAIKYTPAGSSIIVSAKRIDNKISVSIADNGAGIADNIKQKVFEMFFTGDNKVADCRRSLGLGLALCKSIIDAHDGELTLTDNQPHGCIFTFTLPVSEVCLNE